MDVTKPYKFIGFGAMDVTKSYRFIGFGAMDVTKAPAGRPRGEGWKAVRPYTWPALKCARAGYLKATWPDF